MEFKIISLVSRKSSILALSLVLTSYLPVCFAADTTGIEGTQNAILDLGNKALSGEEVYSLSGSWTFYWQEFIDQDHTEVDKPQNEGVTVKIPSYWSTYTFKGEKLPGLGYGSYHLTVILPKERKDTLALKIPVFDSSYKLFVNGKNIASNGITGTGPENSKPAYHPMDRSFYLAGDTLSITIWVSNFSHRRGGFWKNMYLGTEAGIQHLSQKSKSLNDYSQAILLAFALFFIVFQVLLQRERIMLYFALSMIGIFIRSLSTDFYSIANIIPISWENMIRVEYISTYLAYIFGAWYLFHLFPSKVLKTFIYINCGLMLSMIVLVLVSPVPVFSVTSPIFQLISSLLFTYFLIRSFYGLIKLRVKESLYFISFLILIIGEVHDILLAQSMIVASYGYIMPYALITFAFIQAGVLIGRWVEAFKTTEKLHQENIYINENLEQLVKSRTIALDDKNRELEAGISFKNRLFSIIAHDLKTPVISLQQLTDLMLVEKDIKNQDKILSTVKQMTTSVLYLIDNLILWGMNQDKRIASNPEYISIMSSIANVLEVLKENAAWKEIEIVNSIDPEVTAFCDQRLFEISIRNLITNAIKFTDKQGKIQILADFPDKDMVRICVEDNGMGISDTKRDEILAGMRVESSPGTSQEKGTGLGLSLVRDLMIINGGSLNIEAIPEGGTRVCLSLPRKKR